eukprot:73794_1
MGCNCSDVINNNPSDENKSKARDFECNSNNKQNQANEIFIDIKIFEENKNECLVGEAKEGDIIGSCTRLTRVCTALQYYNVLTKNAKHGKKK